MNEQVDDGGAAENPLSLFVVPFWLSILMADVLFESHQIEPTPVSQFPLS